MGNARRIRIFSRDREAILVSRPNRFVIIARDGDEELVCHCPNPGRILEFAIPGTPLILERRKDVSGQGQSKTGWTAVAVRYHGAIVPLAPARMNRVAGELILPGILPAGTILRPEYKVGGSRFDFLASEPRGQRHLIEIKTCSLVEEGLAMFPDAPSLRASRHLEELSELAGEGYASHVLFVIAHGRPLRLAPNIHTDPVFSETLARVAGVVDLQAALTECDEDGWARLVDPTLPVDLSNAGLANEDRGSYLVVIELPEARRIEVGALGQIGFAPGWYVYAGSAQRGLASRLARHQRKLRKGRHWHLDYLTPYAGRIEGYPIASRDNLECKLAEALGKIGGRAIPGFGSSDCGCGSHLYWFAGPPVRDRGFVEIVLRFRHGP